jgi:hypothetical protein
MNLVKKYYKRRLSQLIMLPVLSDVNWDSNCAGIKFDNFGESVKVMSRLLFFNSNIYLGRRLLGCFYGRSWGFFGATNYVCSIGRDRIKFKNACGGVQVINVKTRESLLLKAPINRFASRITGRIIVRLADNSEMTVLVPRVISVSQIGLPTYARFVFANDVAIRVLLYGRGSSDSERMSGKWFNQAINPCDVEKLSLVQSSISLPMLLATAMYLRVHMATRWLIG